MSFYVGRKEETLDFMQLRRKKSSSLVICHGRRRIGKSTFISECARKFDHFLVFEGLPPRRGITKQDQLASFAERLAQQTPLPKVSLDSWPQAFQLLSSVIPSSGWTVLLLDEISWMAIGDPDFAGHLKSAWDNHFSRRSKLVVVLCGSVSSWIDSNILNNTGFVGRCSRQILLGPLALPDCNLFWRSKKTNATEKLKMLSVTGGVPRYLEELDPAQDAEQNIHRMCFEPGSPLFHEFDQIFHDIFSRRATTYREIVNTLVNGRRTVSQISWALKQSRGGNLSAALHDLEQAGFLCGDVSFDLKTGCVRPRSTRYRLSDNYVRFYLRYVAPIKTQIKMGLYRQVPLESFRAWPTIMGLQFENLVLGSFDVVRRELGLERLPVLNAGPYWQNKTQRQQACQIDLLLRTKHSLYVVEVKLRGKIDRSVIGEVREKVRRLKIPGDLSVRTALIYQGELQAGIEEDGYFDFLIPFGELLDR
jgi:uncharacterized protein